MIVSASSSAPTIVAKVGTDRTREGGMTCEGNKPVIACTHKDGVKAGLGLVASGADTVGQALGAVLRHAALSHSLAAVGVKARALDVVGGNAGSGGEGRAVKVVAALGFSVANDGAVVRLADHKGVGGASHVVVSAGLGLATLLQGGTLNGLKAGAGLVVGRALAKQLRALEMNIYYRCLCYVSFLVG